MRIIKLTQGGIFVEYEQGCQTVLGYLVQEVEGDLLGNKYTFEKQSELDSEQESQICFILDELNNQC